MRTLFSILFVLAALGVSAQSYTVTYVKGHIYQDQKQVKLHDKLQGTTQLSSDDQSAELGLFSLQNGRLRLTFEHSKAVQAKQAKEENAVYKLIVSDNIQKYTTEKMLTARGDFDLKTYLSRIDGGEVLLVENEHLPLRSHFMDIQPADRFFVCRPGSTDTICRQLSVAGNDLVIDTASFSAALSGTQFNCLVKFTGTRNGVYRETELTGQVAVTFLSSTDLQAMINSFTEGWDTYYAQDRQKLVNDIELQLGYNYGEYDKPAVEQVILSLLSK